MLLSLSIRDFVLVRSLDLAPGEGFTALTGETGAGKSIILDALSLALGGAADRAMIRAGAEQASVAAEFAPAPAHPVWALLAGQGVSASPDETLTLKRFVRTGGPARAFINDQPVSAALLAEAGDLLVEMHAQHAASMLLRPTAHRRLLDQFGQHQACVQACADSYARFLAARAARKALACAQAEAQADREWLEQAAAELEQLAPLPGEAERLSTERAQGMQTERVREAASEAESALSGTDIESALSRAARAAERICRLPGFESETGPLPRAARLVAEAAERALIEVREAGEAVAALGALADDASGGLDAIEARLFALRALGRKHRCDPDALNGLLVDLRARLELAQQGDGALADAIRDETCAGAAWHAAAAALSAARKAAADRLEAAIARELAPLKLGRARVRVALAALGEGEAGAMGAEAVEFEAETNPGAGFGPLRKIASGGEMARFSLALKCALAEAGSATVLVFDEADQGVGGAVAAAIGERMVRLSRSRQVLAVTHSPQVAAAADGHWLIEKGNGKAAAGGTRLIALEARQRQEEIARMLSGAEITDEARAAAGRLLEDA